MQSDSAEERNNGLPGCLDGLEMRFSVTVFFLMSIVLNGLGFNVFMAGDSHVSGRIYPERVGDILVDADPEIDFDYYGKAGAGFYTYNESPSLMNRIYEAQPDILIVHLGTNDSFTNNFDKQKFKNDLKEFYDNVKQRLPRVKMVFVTPFYNKLKGKLNRNTRQCADAYLEFASTHPDAGIIDNNATHGMDFLDGGAELIRHDNVHLTPAGYEELGDQVGEALIEMEDLWLIGEEPYIE